MANQIAMHFKHREWEWKWEQEEAEGKKTTWDIILRLLDPWIRGQKIEQTQSEIPVDGRRARKYPDLSSARSHKAEEAEVLPQHFWSISKAAVPVNEPCHWILMNYTPGQGEGT